MEKATYISKRRKEKSFNNSTKRISRQQEAPVTSAGFPGAWAASNRFLAGVWKKIFLGFFFFPGNHLIFFFFSMFSPWRLLVAVSLDLFHNRSLKKKKKQKHLSPHLGCVRTVSCVFQGLWPARDNGSVRNLCLVGSWLRGFCLGPRRAGIFLPPTPASVCCLQS